MIIDEICLKPGKYSVKYSGIGSSDTDFSDKTKTNFQPEPAFLIAYRAFRDIVGEFFGLKTLEEKRVNEADVDKQKAYAMLDKTFIDTQEAINNNIIIDGLKFKSKNGSSSVQIKGELVLRNEQSITFTTPFLVYNQEYSGLGIELHLEELVMEVKKQAIRYINLCKSDKEDLFSEVEDYQIQKVG